MVKAFTTDPRYSVFLLSTRAGALGINLVAADTVIFYDSDFNPSMDAQAMDRVHRIGQTKNSTIYRLVCVGTVDEHILRRAARKRRVQNTVYQGGDGADDAEEEMDDADNDDDEEDDDEDIEQEQQHAQKHRKRQRKV
jgi:DNA helicase INO80